MKVSRLPKVALLVLCVSAGASAQHAAPSPPPKVDTPAYEVLTQTAKSLGMVRGMSETWRSINRIYYIASGEMSTLGASGEWNDYAVKRAFFEMSYTQRAIRADVVQVDGDGREEREITVVRGDIAWNEDRPGLGATLVAKAADQRRWQLYATPHGAVRAALEAESAEPTSVQIGSENGELTLEFMSPDGSVKIVLGAGNLPSAVEIAPSWPTPESVVVTQFDDYRDWELLDVLFPAAIVQIVNGRTTRSFEVSEFRTNPYVVFPIPEALADG